MGRTRESANLVSDKNIFVDIANDLVGIGTTAPTATLEVSGTLNVSGVSTFQGNVDLGDNDRLRFGDSDDLQIYHDGSNSFIKEDGTGSLVINASQLFIKDQFDSETHATFNSNGKVELYYDNSKKFETTGAGVTVTGITTSTGFRSWGVTFDASPLGSGSDSVNDAALVMERGNTIYVHQGGYLRRVVESNGTELNIGQLGTSHFTEINISPGTTGGQVKLHAGGSGDNTKLETTGGGVTVTGIVTATSFSGDGSNLTNVPTGFSPINFVLS